ncbi:MAG: hypothetical protein ABIQ27_11070 [Flavobacterium sp.]|uniref:hypothetical protein n=1 Tax=Flavobacterium sp. TaxID=239 RepID=UPI0032676AB5
MNSNQKGNQFGQGSEIDSRKKSDTEKNMNTASGNPEANDDDFLSGDNKSKTYPNNQNNPNEGYNKQMAPGGRNPNIGGNENEYEDSLDEEDRNNYRTPEDDDDFINNENDVYDSEEEEEKEEENYNETRYSSPSRNGSHRNH